MPQDPFANRQSSITAPALGVVSITPDDSTDLTTFVRGLCVSSAGTVHVTAIDGSEASIFIAAGAPFPVRVRRVWATGTDAAGIVGLI